METIEIKYGSMREQNPIIPLLDEPSFEVLEDWGEDSPILLNGVKTVISDAEQFFLYDTLGFCGCGTPGDSQVFWLAQIKSVSGIASFTDYFGFPGGVEFFISRAVEQKILTKEGQLTNLGRLTVLFMEKYHQLFGDDIDDPEIPEPYENINNNNPLLTTGESRKDYFLMRFMTFIVLRKRMENVGKTFYETYPERLGLLNNILPDPVYYWTAYQLGEMGWEEHGGTAPGWLTDDGFEVYWKLVDEFGVGEIEIFDLLEKGYRFEDADLLKEELQKRRNLFVTARPDLDWDTIIPLPIIDIRSAIKQSFEGE